MKFSIILKILFDLRHLTKTDLTKILKENPELFTDFIQSLLFTECVQNGED